MQAAAIQKVIALTVALLTLIKIFYFAGEAIGQSEQQGELRLFQKKVQRQLEDRDRQWETVTRGTWKEKNVLHAQTRSKDSISLL